MKKNHLRKMSANRVVKEITNINRNDRIGAIQYEMVIENEEKIHN